MDTQTILTIHNNVITRNPRISLKRPKSNVWTLQLQRVQPDDRGWYMCQINTDPMRHRSGYFEVVGKDILGQILLMNITSLFPYSPSQDYEQE